MKATHAIAISIAAHVAVVALALAWEPPPRELVVLLPPVPIEIVTPTPPAERTEVTLFDYPAPEDVAPEVVAVAPPAARTPIVPPTTRPSETRPSAPAIRTGATSAVETTRPGTTEPLPGTSPPTRNSLLAMRGHPQPDLRLRADLHDDLDRVPRGTTPQPEVEATGQLQPSGGGTYHSNQGVFTVRVARDGSVNLKDAKNLRVSLPDPRKLPKRIGAGVASWLEQDTKTPGDPEREAINNHRSGDRDTRPDHGGTVPIVGGGFDLSDALMRRKGQDPYASKKLKYLDSTRDERVQIGTKYKQQQLAQSPELMQKNIAFLYAHTLDPAARKQGLFELWDDCAESGDPALVEGGRAARLLVLGVIRARFPAASDHAFSATELAMLNRTRQSKPTFAPY